ncbi:MAG: ABC transporter ATP-binding protein [Treponema sp.]|jgi:iron complex transport system ATP-binding protein|nr:ABC transporter ATP-binding protein [Treponema sp.]
MALRVSHIQFGYTAKELTVKDISFEAARGALVCVAGPNGCGKTTFIKCVNRILPARAGSVELDGVNLWALPSSRLARHIAYVPQFSGMTLAGSTLETVILGRRPYINWRLSNEDIETAIGILSRLGMASCASKNFSELSGGQKQKALIARALAQNPDIYLLDEPTSALDIKNQFEIMDMMKEITSAENKIAVMVMHDLSLAMRKSDLVLLLNGGSLAAFGPPREVLTRGRVKEVWDMDVRIIDEKYIVPE